MPVEKTDVAQFQVGTFICPHTKQAVPLTASQALPYLNWPAVIEKCPACGDRHVLHSEEVEHPPAFGYE